MSIIQVNERSGDPQNPKQLGELSDVVQHRLTITEEWHEDDSEEPASGSYSGNAQSNLILQQTFLKQLQNLPVAIMSQSQKDAIERMATHPDFAQRMTTMSERDKYVKEMRKTDWSVKINEFELFTYNIRDGFGMSYFIFYGFSYAEDALSGNGSTVCFIFMSIVVILDLVIFPLGVFAIIYRCYLCQLMCQVIRDICCCIVSPCVVKTGQDDNDNGGGARGAKEDKESRQEEEARDEKEARQKEEARPPPEARHKEEARPPPEARQKEEARPPPVGPTAKTDRPITTERRESDHENHHTCHLPYDEWKNYKAVELKTRREDFVKYQYTKPFTPYLPGYNGLHCGYRCCARLSSYVAMPVFLALIFGAGNSLQWETRDLWLMIVAIILGNMVVLIIMYGMNRGSCYSKGRLYFYAIVQAMCFFLMKCTCAATTEENLGEIPNIPNIGNAEFGGANVDVDQNFSGKDQHESLRVEEDQSGDFDRDQQEPSLVDSCIETLSLCFQCS